MGKEPTLSSLIATNQGLRLYCNCRGDVKVLTPLGACANYGGLLKFSEIRAVLQARCTAKPCMMEIGPTVEPYTEYNEKGERRNRPPKAP